MENQTQNQQKKKRAEKPKPSILDSKFKYVHSSKTSVQKTWEKFGFKPVWGSN